MLVPMRMLSSTSIRSFLRQPELRRPERHDLHEADGAGRGHGERIESALDVDHGEHELWPVAQHRVLARLAMHRAQDAFGRGLEVFAEPEVRGLLSRRRISTRGCISANHTTSSYLPSKQVVDLMAAAMTSRRPGSFWRVGARDAGGCKRRRVQGCKPARRACMRSRRARHHPAASAAAQELGSFSPAGIPRSLRRAGGGTRDVRRRGRAPTRRCGAGCRRARRPRT